jgi:hypothetical protein
MLTFPNAKINLGLNITEKRPDGYHNLETIFYPVPIEDALEINILNEGKGKFRQSNKSQDFITPDDNVEEKQKQTYIKTGRLLHKLFATIKTKADICPAIDELVAEGVLDDETMTADQLRKMVEKRMTNKQVAEKEVENQNAETKT